VIQRNDALAFAGAQNSDFTAEKFPDLFSDRYPVVSGRDQGRTHFRGSVDPPHFYLLVISRWAPRSKSKEHFCATPSYVPNREMPHPDTRRIAIK
jgi:hypothetical protein